jgi:hypothetical protein
MGDACHGDAVGLQHLDDSVRRQPASRGDRDRADPVDPACVARFGVPTLEGTGRDVHVDYRLGR